MPGKVITIYTCLFLKTLSVGPGRVELTPSPHGSPMLNQLSQTVSGRRSDDKLGRQDEEWKPLLSLVEQHLLLVKGSPHRNFPVLFHTFIVIALHRRP